MAALTFGRNPGDLFNNKIFRATANQAVSRGRTEKIRPIRNLKHLPTLDQHDGKGGNTFTPATKTQAFGGRGLD